MSKTIPSNQVPKNYSKHRCQLPSYLLVKKVGTFRQDHSHRADPDPEANYEQSWIGNNKTEYWTRITWVRLLKTISTLFVVRVHRMRPFHLMTTPTYVLCSPKVNRDVGWWTRPRTKTAVLTVALHFLGLGALVKSGLLCSLNDHSASTHMLSMARSNPIPLPISLHPTMTPHSILYLLPTVNQDTLVTKPILIPPTLPLLSA